MVVGIGMIQIMIHDASSLKSKRRVVKSILGRVRSKFHLSIAEVDDQDKWQSCSIGFAVVTNEAGLAHTMLQNVADYIEGLHLAEVTNYDIEILHY
ncbi:MAG: DUF503 domain-containing protein [Deltaproteobacteria bacterium]|nr:DUF503 domain-containing protein [Deltaproteobacteria bacterium]